MEQRRAQGTGTYYADRTRGAGHWIVSVEAGWSRTGSRRRVRRRVTGTERQARAALVALLREATTEQQTSPTTTVKTWAEQWLEVHQTTVRPHAWDTDASQVRVWIIPTIGHRRLTQLTPGDVRAVSKAILAAGRAPATAQRAHMVLQKMLRDALIEGHAVPPRILEITAPARGEVARREIPAADAVSILAVASTRPDASRWVAALLQGMRPAECRGLTWECVDLDAGTIDVSWQLKTLPYRTPRDRSSGFRVPVGYTARHLVDAYHLVRPKTNAGRRVIPLVPWMTDSLKAWRDLGPQSPYGLVWPDSDGRPLNDVHDRDAWRALCTAAEVGPYDLYACRHTTATLLREAGVDDTTLIAIMGHASVLSTRAYLHSNDDRARDALTGLAGRLGLTPPSAPAEEQTLQLVPAPDAPE